MSKVIVHLPDRKAGIYELNTPELLAEAILWLKHRGYECEVIEDD